MPNSKTLILGSSSYKPTDADVQRLDAFLQWLPTAKKPSSVVLVSPDAFSSVAEKLGGRDTLISFTNGDRVYLNSAALNPSPDFLNTVVSNLRTPLADQSPQQAYGSAISPSNLAEWTLAHETSHINSKLNPQQQEDRDYLQSQDASRMMREYSSNRGRAYQQAQSQVFADRGQFEPASEPIATELQPPQPVASIRNPAQRTLEVHTGHEGSSL